MAIGDENGGRRKGDFEPSGGTPKLRILAVDDDAAYLKYLHFLLTRGGFDLELASDGSAAIERLRNDGQAGVDLLLIDFAMPGIDGIEAVRRIRDDCPAAGLYTILLTANNAIEIKLRALDSGLDDFLAKTSTASEILAKIRSAARRIEMERRLHLQNEELKMLALTDELTGIANRRALFRAGEEILASGRQMTVVLFDLDHFKRINDTFGHLIGDRILAEVAATFKENTRYGDVIGRYGGDEFVMLLPETEVDEAQQISERILSRVRGLTWSIGEAILSISAQRGIATSSPGTTLSDLIAICDQALYRRKQRRLTDAPGASEEPLDLRP